MGFVVLVVYKYLSSPTAITEAKDKIKGNILAIRIYKDFWKIIVLSFFKSMFYTFKYFLLNFGPVLLIIPILFPMFAQMDVRYGMRPFNVGEEITVRSAYSADPASLDVKLEENATFKQKVNPVFINAFQDEAKTKPIRQVSWRLQAEKEGETKIQIKVKDKVYEKTLVIGDSKAALSNKKFAQSDIAHFWYPAEDLLKDSNDLQYVYFAYPGRNVDVLGFEIHWIILNLILVVIVVLAFKKKFGVEF